MADRVEELETKVAFLEKQVADLDEVVQQLRGVVDQSRTELQHLIENANTGTEVDEDLDPLNA